MTQKLAFELTRADGTDRYAIRLTDKHQAAAMAISHDLAAAKGLEPFIVIYDEGNGELVPVDGFDETTARGRFAMTVLNKVYCDALDRIEAGTQERLRPAVGETFVFQY